MTAEGIFPKVDGDILYASEVNSFRGVQFMGAGALLLTSGTAAQRAMGSIVVPAGSLSNPTNLIITLRCDNNTGGIGVIVSGTNASDWLAESNNGVHSYYLNTILGSPYYGGGFGIQDSSVGVYTFGNNVYPSGLKIYFMATSSVPGSITYFVQAIGNGGF